MPPGPPRRKPIRLRHEAYVDTDQAFLITICTERGRPLFAHAPYAEAVFTSLVDGPVPREATCLAACLMPDHLHLLVIPRAADLVSLIDRWKSFTTNLLHRMGLEGRVWQRSFHDHALRGNEAAEHVAAYIIANPVRRGLAPHWQAYPYSWLRERDAE